MREGQPRRGWRFAVLALASFGLAALVLQQPGRPLLVYNASASLPRGFYLARAVETLALDDLVLVYPPTSARQLAAERGYLPISVPLIKPIAALAGDHICVAKARVYIAGKPVAALRQADSAGRLLPVWRACRALAEGEVFLLAPQAASSFDSRYFGPVRQDALLARLVPLWTW